eukprot:8255147-Alexandrium_andersonii.AAC.1
MPYSCGLPAAALAASARVHVVSVGACPCETMGVCLVSFGIRVGVLCMHHASAGDCRPAVCLEVA